ncbi:MAG: hypothetical protein V4685_02165 [Bacteroidota bacterium]
MITRTHKIVSGVIFLIVSLLIFDNYCFIKKPETVVVSSKDVVLSAGNRASRPGHSTDFIIDTKGNKYKVPNWLFRYYHIGDSFSVTRSLIFNKAIRIESYGYDEYVKENIGVLNSDGFSITVSIIPLLLCIVTIFFGHLLKNEGQQFAVLGFPIILAVVIIAFYFIFST